VFDVVVLVVVVVVVVVVRMTLDGTSLIVGRVVVSGT
jgi:hypothetical protein